MNASPQLADRIARVRSRRLGVSPPTVSDSRAAQKPPALDILVHDCFNQRLDEKKQPCKCQRRIGFIKARTLIEKGKADWLRYVRGGKTLENRKSLVLTAETIAQLGKSEDAMYHKRWLSLTNFEEYHAAPFERAQPSIDIQIEAVRVGTIREHKVEISARRKHRVHPKGAAPDSDASAKDILNSDTGFSARASGFASPGKADRVAKNIQLKDGTLVATGLGGGDSHDPRKLKAHEARLDSKIAVKKAMEEAEIRLLAGSAAQEKAKIHLLENPKKIFQKSFKQSKTGVCKLLKK